MFQLLSKSFPIPLGLKAAASAIDAEIQKNLKLPQNSTNNIKWRNEDIMKIVKSVGDSGLLITGVTETVEIETKQQKGRFLVSY